MRPIIEPVGPPEHDEPPQPLHGRLAWFAVYWVGGIAALAALAYTLRAMMGLG